MRRSRASGGDGGKDGRARSRRSCRARPPRSGSRRAGPLAAAGALILAACMAAAAPGDLRAQAAEPPAPALGLEAARAATAAAGEAARERGWAVVIAVVDAGGLLVHLARMDGVQPGSVRVAEEKARSAALFRRPTRQFQEWVSEGNTAILGLPGAVPLEGGVPLRAGGEVVGAIGVSGRTAAEDGVVAAAGAEAFEGGAGR